LRPESWRYSPDIPNEMLAWSKHHLHFKLNRNQYGIKLIHRDVKNEKSCRGIGVFCTMSKSNVQFTDLFNWLQTWFWKSSPSQVPKNLKLDLQGFRVLRAMVMKSYIFWDITPCSPLKINRLLGRTYRLHPLTFNGLHGVITRR
jgi:hypothetical protein